ncbi:MAG TPA: hypothetical protein VGJ25_16205 [Gaiellaceae bacterium]|jgi:hypothetical protein
MDPLKDMGELAGAAGGYWPTIEGTGLWRKRVIIGDDPAAGAEVALTVEKGRAWIVYAIRIPFVTDATVATRVVGLRIDDGNSVYFEAPSGAGQAASLTMAHVFSTAGFNGNEAGVRSSGGLFVPCVLLRGHRILTVTTNIQAGDNFGRPVLYVDELMDR